MRNRLFLMVIALLLLFTACAFSDGASFTVVPDTLHPGKAERISFSLPGDDTVSLLLLNQDGSTACEIRGDMTVSAGLINLSWNGLNENGAPLDAGQYTLRLVYSGGVCDAALNIGRVAPQITAVSADTLSYASGGDLLVTINCNMAGALSLTLRAQGMQDALIYAENVSQGENIIRWDGLTDGAPVPDGEYALLLQLTDDTGFSGNARQISLTLKRDAVSAPAQAQAEQTAAYQPAAAQKNESRTIRPSALAEETIPGNYWSMEVENLDWAAIWQVMTAPMTVIDGDDQRETYKLRKTPDTSLSSSNVVGEITFESQGVNVLETLENGWSYVEAYNSSYGPDCDSRRGYGNTDELIYGYVKTSLLKQFTPRTDYGLLIDKLSQTMYILTEKGLFTTVAISTGAPTSSQPWNETPAGEYYLCSKVGDFPAGNLTCGYGMRINGGCILHEVPYILNEKYNIKDYSSTEPYLGSKASHGCVRVQRKKNEDEINMLWIWKNVPLKTKVLIWDDTGRMLPYPVADDTPIYYNPDGGKYYHADQYCADIKDRYLPLKGVTTYGELDTAAYQKLTPCKGCNPPARKSEIDAANAKNGF